jgi:Uri superfamily endonuclease
MKKMSEKIPKEKGVYVIVASLGARKTIRVGKLGTFVFPGGFYAYAGSARGPGGLSARIGHHAKISRKPHWHMDYLRRRARLIEAWVSSGNIFSEHCLATALGGLPGARMPVSGFGCSDCRCLSHLFHFVQAPCFETFRRLLAIEATDGASVEKLELCG